MSKPIHTCGSCSNKIYSDNISGLCWTCRYPKRETVLDSGFGPQAPVLTPTEQVLEDRQKKAQRVQIATLQAKYAESLKTIEQQERVLGWLDQIRTGIDATFKIVPKESSGTSEATPVLIASDWHSEELVTPAQVNGLNEFNPIICERRVTQFFQGGLRLIRLLNQDTKISTIVLALLGDFITNDIHEADSAENNAVLPINAIIDVQKKIIGGIEFLLNHSKYEIIIPCKVGNHSRTTRKVRHASEAGHSLETLMYVNIAAYFRTTPRVRFVIDDGYHTYLDVYDKTIRFHHGHDIQYQGGVGGIYIPANKSINQWNRGRRADLDVFGHFHQFRDGGSFLCNGSLIGYSAYALSIKGDFEVPKQGLFLMDKKRGKTCVWPVLV